jgi:hypothetical protein
MELGTLLHAEQWAEQIFGGVELGDPRRKQRLLRIASAQALRPGLSLPKQLQGAWEQIKGAYRFFQNQAIHYEQLARPVWEQTRAQMAQEGGTLLLVQDTTELNFGPFPSVQGLGPLENEYQQGMLLQTMLAVCPQGKRVLGIAYQAPFIRQPLAQSPEQKRERRHQRRQEGVSEAMVWPNSVLDLGPPAAGQRLVHVGDRAADFFRFFSTCRQTQTAFVVRACQKRAVSGESMQLMELARALPAQAQGEIEVSSEHKRRARTAKVQVAWKAITLSQPEDERRRDRPEEPMSLWVLRVWEPEPPLRQEAERPLLPREAAAAKAGQPRQEEERVEALEWVLLTSVPIENEQDAWERVGWYGCRWLCEEFHRGLKTGCRMEKQRLRMGEGLMNQLAVLSPIAARLLQLRDLIQYVPETPVRDLLPKVEQQIVAKLAQVPVERLTAETLVRTVAKLGGFLGRRSDGQPGWQSLWEGWFQIQLMVQGVRLFGQEPR